MTSLTKTLTATELLEEASTRTRELTSLTNVPLKVAPTNLVPVALQWSKVPGSVLEAWEAHHPVIGSYRIIHNSYESPYEVSTPFLAGKTSVAVRDDLEAAKKFASEHLLLVARSLLADI